MTRELQFSRRGAATGRVRSLVIFLHGYGADGQDLLGLADPLAPHLPDTVFIAPDAPERCSGNPFGFQWFPIPWLDGSSPEAAEAGLRAAAADLDAFLTARLADE
ncbi:phospholipase, partial [Thioclava sp. BHET1]